MSNSTKDDNSPLGEDESATVLLITQEVDREHQPSRRRKDRNELAPHLFAASPPLISREGLARHRTPRHCPRAREGSQDPGERTPGQRGWPRARGARISPSENHDG